MARKLLLAAALLLVVVSAKAQRVTNACEKACSWDLAPICVEHYDTGCKPSWWGNPGIQNGKCMSLKGPKIRTVMPNLCKYKCIAAQYCFEAWEQVEKKVKLSAYCKKQWKKFGFQADPKCHKC